MPATLVAAATFYNHFLQARIDAYAKTRETVMRPKIVPGTDGERMRDANGKVVYEEVPNPDYDPNAKPMKYADRQVLRNNQRQGSACLRDDGSPVRCDRRRLRIVPMGHHERRRRVRLPRAHRQT